MSKDLKKFMCIGKKIVGTVLNYKSQAAAKCIPIPGNPTFFLKPTTTYLTVGQKIKIPGGYEVHNEVSLGAIIKCPAKNVAVERAKEFIGGYTIALDLTGINVLEEIRACGNPWTAAKAWDGATPVGPFIPACGDLSPCSRVFCCVNGNMRQDAKLSDMIFQLDCLIAQLSQIMTLEAADLVLTGTPCGTEKICSGDKITIGFDDTTAQFDVC